MSVLMIRAAPAVPVVARLHLLFLVCCVAGLQQPWRHHPRRLRQPHQSVHAGATKKRSDGQHPCVPGQPHPSVLPVGRCRCCPAAAAAAVIIVAVAVVVRFQGAAPQQLDWNHSRNIGGPHQPCRAVRAHSAHASLLLPLVAVAGAAAAGACGVTVLLPGRAGGCTRIRFLARSLPP